MKFFPLLAYLILMLQSIVVYTRGLHTCKNVAYAPEEMFQLKLEKRRKENNKKQSVLETNKPEALIDIKSEPAPGFNSGPVKIGVGKNFNDLVLNNKKDTIVALYAPWCQYCQALLPHVEHLGEMLKDEDISVVKMDATKNDPPANYDVPSYPTIYWAPKDSKYYPQIYDGGRTAFDMLKFIAKHSTNELKNYDRNGNIKLKLKP